jgi:hypothetical protein
MNLLPPQVISEVIRQQTKMGWPEMVPAWVELPDASGVDRYHRYQDVTIGLCDQLVEHHTRLARFILTKRYWVRSHGRLEDLARHILLARLFRCRYIQLIGKEDSTEDDMPFAHNRW